MAPDPLGSQGHPHRHLPLSLRGNLSAFAVVLVSETPNQTDGLPRVRVHSNPHLQRLAPYTSPQSTAMNEYSRGFGSKLSFSSTFLIHPSTHDFETDSESRPNKLDVFLRLSPKAFRSTAVTLSSNLFLFLTKTFKFLKNAKTSVVGSTVGRKTQFRGAHHLSLIRTPSVLHN